MLERFAIECELLSCLHHPCIVQFLDIFFECGSQLPVMVMEFLHTTLSNLIDDYGILPEEISYDVFRDVALGLRYLHEQSPCIVHRDLSANNVLLSKEMNAKISDLGVAKILNLRPSQMTQTQTPGTPAYIPPEAMTMRPKYTSKVDIFSFGVMMVHVLSGQWPIPGSVFRVDPGNPSAVIPLSEIERRAENFEAIRPDHPLMDLIRLCMSNPPDPRPEAVEILRQVNAMIAQLPPSFANKIEMIQQLHTQNTDREVANLRREVEAISGLSESLRSEIESKTGEIEAQRREIAEKGREIEALRGELEALQHETEAQVKTVKQEGRAHQRELEAQRRDNQLLREQLEKQGIPFPKPTASELPHPFNLAKIQWKRVADLPMGMAKAQSVLVRGKVYIGGGSTVAGGDSNYRVFQYDPGKNSWSVLPPCPVSYFAMGEFQGELITVGGIDKQNAIVGTVHRYHDHSQQWQEHLLPMTVARNELAIITTELAIIACGGDIGRGRSCATVEVYTTTTCCWHVTDSLPVQCYGILSVRIGDASYLLGGLIKSEHTYSYTSAVLCASISTLIQRATSTMSSVRRLPKSSAWNTVVQTPLLEPGAVNLGGHLVSVGGHSKVAVTSSPAVYVLVKSTNTWKRMPSGDLPVPMNRISSIQLSDNQVLALGIWAGNNTKCNVYVGTF